MMMDFIFNSLKLCVQIAFFWYAYKKYIAPFLDASMKDEKKELLYLQNKKKVVSNSCVFIKNEMYREKEEYENLKQFFVIWHTMLTHKNEQESKNMRLLQKKIEERAREIYVTTKEKEEQSILLKSIFDASKKEIMAFYEDTNNQQAYVDALLEKIIDQSNNKTIEYKS